MITPYFKMEEIEEIINDKNLAKKLLNEAFGMNMEDEGYKMEGYEDEEGYEDDEEYEDEMETENDVENMSDKEKVKLAYEILSMTKYEDDFFMSILGKLRKIMRG